MVKSTAEKLYDSLSTFTDLENLITQGEAEGLYLECKSPSDPNLSKEMTVHLAKAASGFSNTEGGVLLYGISTTNHKHSGLDVLSQIEPIGQCGRFAKQIENTLPRLTTPSITNYKIKRILERTKDKKGVVAVLFLKTTNNPVQATNDKNFYFRTGDNFTPAPYEILKRLFAASTSPDLSIDLSNSDLKYDKTKHLWEIPVIIKNKSISSAEKYHISITFKSTRSYLDLRVSGFKNMSKLNPGKKIFMKEKGPNSSIIYRSVNMVMGTIKFKMKPRYRKFKFEIILLAHLMQGRKIYVEVDLITANPKVLIIKEELMD